MEPVVALFENRPDILHIHFEQAGDGFRRLTAVMSPGKNIPLEFGPLTKSPVNFTEQIISAYFGSGGGHNESPYQHICVLSRVDQTGIHTIHFFQKIVKEPQYREISGGREAEGIPPSFPAAGEISRKKSGLSFS